MHKDDRVRLQHMLDAAHEAVGFAQGRAPLIAVLERALRG